MNTTSRAILQTVLVTDSSLSVVERNAAQRLIDGQIEASPVAAAGTEERLLVTQKRAAELLSVSRVTIWRMTKDCNLHPVEILPGTWRYSYREIAALALRGLDGESAVSANPGQISAA
jgi:predicted DNA-binding transcriptional regulator AlpA